MDRFWILVQEDFNLYNKNWYKSFWVKKNILIEIVHLKKIIHYECFLDSNECSLKTNPHWEESLD